MHWLLHQFYLTGLEVRDQITIPHLITGMIAYAIIHGFFKLNKHLEKRLKHAFMSDHDRLIHAHNKSGHKGRFYRCKPCASTARDHLQLQELRQQLQG